MPVLADDDVAVDGNAERSMFPISWARAGRIANPFFTCIHGLETIGVDG
jgi:hypothetical protein